MQTDDYRKLAADRLTTMAEIGEATMEYMDAQAKRKNAHAEYLEARNRFLRGVDGLAREHIGVNSEFHDATDDPYVNFLEARRIEYNAKRRLETKCRNARAGGGK